VRRGGGAAVGVDVEDGAGGKGVDVGIDSVGVAAGVGVAVGSRVKLTGLSPATVGCKVLPTCALQPALTARVTIKTSIAIYRVIICPVSLCRVLLRVDRGPEA